MNQGLRKQAKQASELDLEYSQGGAVRATILLSLSHVPWKVTRASVSGLRGAVKFLSAQCVTYQFFDFVTGYPRVPRFLSPNP